MVLAFLVYRMRMGEVCFTQEMRKRIPVYSKNTQKGVPKKGFRQNQTR